MEKPEFVALQVAVLIRSDAAKIKDAELFLESVEFQGYIQEQLATLIQASLAEARVPFDEIIVSLSTGPTRAKPTGPAGSGDKPSGLGRLFRRG